MNAKKYIIIALSVIISLVLSGCGSSPQSGTQEKTEPQLEASQLKRIAIDSKLLKKKLNVNLYLPKGYGSGEKYPVLYMLHGYSGNEDGWMPGLRLNDKADELIESGRIRPLIIVSPQIGNSYGINSSKETRTLGTPPNASLDEGMYEDYLYKELVTYIDSNYSTIDSRDGRFIGGLSMGGFAALHIAFSHIDMFRKAGGHSPALFIDGFPNNLGQWLYPAEDVRRNRDPVYIAQDKDLKSLEVYLDCGDKDGYRFYEGCEKLYKILQSKGVKSEYHLNPGLHDGAYWETNAEKYLLFYAGKQQD